VPAENLLGERGRGFANFLSILDGMDWRDPRRSPNTMRLSA
jgi:hypothetical protein